MDRWQHLAGMRGWVLRHPKGEILFSSISARLMARQQITSQKSVSRPSDKDVKSDTKSKLVQVAEPAPPHESDASETDESLDDDDEDGGIDEEGLKKLMKALGEDALDEFDLAQLRMLSGAAAGEAGSDEEEDSEDDKEDTDTESVPEDAEPRDEEEEGIALDDDEVDSVDQDAIPLRKVQVDNKVRLFPLFTCQLVLFNR